MSDTFSIDACEEAFVRDFCPYKGSPDPLVVWRAAWKAAIAHAVPPGHQVVPDEPTQQMCQEGQWKAKEWPKFPLRIVPIYQAMLNAAPGHLLVNPIPAGRTSKGT